MPIIISFFIKLHNHFRNANFAKQRQIKKWAETWHIAEHWQIFHKLYSDVNGFSLSRQARSEHDAMEYTYGEIEFTPFIALLSQVKPNENTIFFDLGSGVGKAVLAIAMVFDIKESYGIELFSQLHQAAMQQRDRLLKLHEYRQKAQKITFLQGNFLEIDYTKANLVFINATSLFGETWEKLKQQLSKLKPGTIVITTSKKLPAPYFQQTYQTSVQMSWGIVSAFIQQRNDN